MLGCCFGRVVFLCCRVFVSLMFGCVVLLCCCVLVCWCVGMLAWSDVVLVSCCVAVFVLLCCFTCLEQAQAERINFS